MRYLLLILLCIAFLTACRSDEESERKGQILPYGGYPYIMEYDGRYYFTFQNLTVDTVFIMTAPSVEALSKAELNPVAIPGDVKMRDIYSPELHRINGKWYVYFEADDGVNTDNHLLYVLENGSDNPLTGEWVLHGPIVTNEDWNFGLHPTTFTHKGRQYLLWSGWPKRRTEAETQCIYIAEMESPWKLKSERVMISSPDYEWERQWINSNGSRSAYPIYVNENPQVMVSPDGKRIVVGYSASGIWTEFTSLGIIYANADSDFLDPASWHKEPEPFFTAKEGSEIFGCSNISIVGASNKDDLYYLVYQAKKRINENGDLRSDLRWKEIAWNENGLPDFGNP